MVSELAHEQEKLHLLVLGHMGSLNSDNAGVMEAFEVRDHAEVAWPRKVLNLVNSGRRPPINNTLSV